MAKKTKKKVKKKAAKRKTARKKTAAKKKIGRAKKKKAAKKVRRKAKSKRTTVAQLEKSLAASNERVDVLEGLIAKLSRQVRSSRTVRKAPGSARARIYGTRESAAGGKTVGFEKKAGSAQWVRVSVDGHSADIIGPHGSSGELGDLSTGEWIVVRVEVRGNPSDKAEIALDGASPDTIVVTIPTNDNANNGSQPVLVL